MDFEPDDFFDNDETHFSIDPFEEMLNENKVTYFDVEEFQDACDYYMQIGQLDNAIKLVKIARSLHPTSSSIVLKEAEIYINGEQYAVALDLLDGIRALESQNPDYHLLKARIFSSQKQINECRAALLKASDLNIDKNDELYHIIALEFQAIGDYDMTLHFLKQMLEYNDEFDAVIDVVYSLDLIGKEKEGLEIIHSVIDKDPYNADAWMLLGEIYEKQGDTPKALEAYDFAITIAPEQFSAYYSKAAIFYQKDDFKQVIEIYHEAEEFVDDFELTNVYQYIGEAFERLDDFDSAELYYKKSIEADKENPEPFYLLGVLYNNRDLFEEGLKYVSKAIQLNHHIPSYVIAKSDILKNLERFEEALECAEQALALYPEEEYQIAKCDLLLDLGRYNELIEYIDTIRNAAKGERSWENYRLAAAFFILGDFQLGITHLAYALEDSPNNVDDFLEIYPDSLKNDIIVHLIESYNTKSSND